MSAKYSQKRPVNAVFIRGFYLYIPSQSVIVTTSIFCSRLKVKTVILQAAINTMLTVYTVKVEFAAFITDFKAV